MKRRNLWILLAALAVVGIVVLALLGLLGGKKEAKTVDGEPAGEQTAATPEPTPVDPELPMDDSPLVPTDEDAVEEPGAGGPEGGEAVPSADDPSETPQPEEDSLDEDELPILP